ncbi:multicopper oxidase family protein [Cohnella sp.]|uniref:multicopper oxidase family protein n=1 Tax=Cohnella sp. TaxID=1883426 RepID=UPI00356AE35B
MTRKRSAKRLLPIGIPLLLALLVGLTVSVYFWQIRLQKPSEINMGDHRHHSAAAVGAGMHEHAASGVACESLVAGEASGATREFDLTAARTELRLDNGKTLEAWTFNGISPGPELRVNEGDRVVVTLRNEDIEDGVTLHWHGINVPCSQDGVAGVTQDAVKPGESFTYAFVAAAPGTYWYHSHQMSSIQAKKGLLGSIIVEPRNPFGLAPKATEVAALYQRLESAVLLNGSTRGLKVSVGPGETVRLRLTNGDNETMNFSVEGAPFQVVAMDGHDMHEPGLLDGEIVPLGAGQRYDLLVRLPDSGKVVVRNDAADNLPITLGSGSEPARMEGLKTFSFVDYGAPVPNDPLPPGEPDRRYELRLGQLLFVSTINGRSFHEIPPMTVKEGETARITLVNEGGGDHPFHFHGHTFRVLSKNGNPLTGSPVYLDTLLTKKGEIYEIFLVADNPGLWMVHCHNLEHASMGMSMMLNYEGITTSYRVGTKSGNLPDL